MKIVTLIFSFIFALQANAEISMSVSDINEICAKKVLDKSLIDLSDYITETEDRVSINLYDETTNEVVLTFSNSEDSHAGYVTATYIVESYGSENCIVGEQTSWDTAF